MNGRKRSEEHLNTQELLVFTVSIKLHHIPLILRNNKVHIVYINAHIFKHKYKLLKPVYFLIL